MTTPGKTNPPSKTVQGLPEGTLRTTMTHAVAGDLVMVQTITADPESHWVPAPAKPTKRAGWARVQGHEMVGLVVILESTGERIVLDYTGHTAVTIKDREISSEPGPVEKSTARESHYAVDHDTRMLLATRAMAIGYTGEGAATLMENAYWVPAYPAPCGDECDTHPAMRRYANGECEACEVERQAAEREHTERIASDGAVIRVGTRVVVTGDWTADGQPLPGMVTFFDSSAVWVEHAKGAAPLAYGAEMLAREAEPVDVVVVTSEEPPRTADGAVDWREVSKIVRFRDTDANRRAAGEPVSEARKCECGGLKCHGGGPCKGAGTVVNTAAQGRLVGYMCQGCQDRLDAAIPPAPPKSEPQRRAIRLLGELKRSGSQPQINGATLKTLVRDGWVTIDTRPVRSVISLTGNALAWLGGEHTAEVRTLVVGGVTLYGALCNCGREQENPRLKGIPWESAGCRTAEDAVAVALGHGAVSRPQGVPTVGETLAAQEAALAEPEAGTCVDCAAAVLWVHGMWIGTDGAEECPGNAFNRHRIPEISVSDLAREGLLSYEDLTGSACLNHPMGATDVECHLSRMPEISVTDARITAEASGKIAMTADGPRVYGPCECESFVCAYQGGHAMYACQETAADTHFVDLCTGCLATVGQPITPECAAAFSAWQAAEMARYAAEDAAMAAEAVDGDTVAVRALMSGDTTDADAAVAALVEALPTPRGREAVACGECGMIPHDMECLTGLRLDSPTVTARGVCGGCGADGDRHDADCLVAGEPLTAEDLAGLPTAESAAEAHNVGRPWSAKHGKRKASSVAVRRSRQHAGAR